MAEFLKSKTGGPTAKAFNVNFASQLPRLGEARVRPSSMWCGDDEAREVVEQLNRDVGYDPSTRPHFSNAHLQESIIDVIFAISEVTR